MATVSLATDGTSVPRPGSRWDGMGERVLSWHDRARTSAPMLAGRGSSDDSAAETLQVTRKVIRQRIAPALPQSTNTAGYLEA